MSKGMKKGLYPWRSQFIGVGFLAGAYFGAAAAVWWVTTIFAVLGILLFAVRPFYWFTRGRYGAKASIARSERKQERSGGVMSRWDHMTQFSATAMRLKWARSLQPGRDDIDGIGGLWRIFREPVERYATPVGKSNYGMKYLPANSVMVRIAGARSGKSVALADRILRHVGPIVATSTRTDLVDMTAELRAMKSGPVYFFNAGEVGNVNSTLKWSVLTGCKSMTTAARRARDLIGPIDEGTDRAMWDTNAVAVLGPLMYVAAHHNLPMSAVAKWIGASEAEIKHHVWDHVQQMLLATPDGYHAENLLSQFFHTNDRTRTSVTNSMVRALEWLTNPATAVLGDSPNAEFDIERDLIDADATIYILGKRGGGVKNLTGALIAEIMEVSKAVASRRPGGRLDPALLLALDELALTCPGPVNDWVLDMGGFGITGDFCIQQRASLDEIWGVNGRNVILGNSLVVLLGAGCNQSDVASDFSTMSGSRTEHRRSYSMKDGSKRELSAENEVEVSVVDPGKLMALQIGTAIWFTRGRIDEVKMMRADKRKDVRRVAKNRRAANGQIADRLKGRVADRLNRYEGQAEAEAWAAEEASR